MNKLESIRRCKVDAPVVEYTLPGKPHGARLEICKRGFILQTGTNEPIAVKNADLKRMFEWLRDKIYAEAD